MRNTKKLSLRLLSLMLALVCVCMAGCAGKKSEPEATTPETAAPTQATTPTPPTEPPAPTEPPEPTAHEKLVAYLKEKGAVTVEDAVYTFTMRTESGNILWEYKNDNTNIVVTLVDGAAMQAVDISFASYTATAEVETATYTNVEHQLSNFRCGVPSMMDPLRKMATTAVWSCFVRAAEAMQPSGVNLVDLGFVKYFG